MKDGTPTILYTKETREYARHVRYWRDVRGSQVSLFSLWSRINHVIRVCATSGERQDPWSFAHVKMRTRAPHESLSNRCSIEPAPQLTSMTAEGEPSCETPDLI